MKINNKFKWWQWNQILPKQWVTSAAYPFTVLYHSSDVLEVLKVLCVHWTKLNDFVANSEPLGTGTNNFFSHKNKDCYFLGLNWFSWFTGDKYTSQYSQLHRQVSLVSQHPPVRMVAAGWPPAPLPPRGPLPHPVPAWLSHEHAAYAGLLLSLPLRPCDHSVGLKDRFKALPRT